MIELKVSVSLPLDAFELSAECVLRDTVTAVVGNSGSGKTSLLECIAGLRPLASGMIVLDGAVVLDSVRRINLPPERRRIAYVPQDAAVFPHLDVRHNVLFAGNDSVRFKQLCELLELGSLLRRFPSTLSGGEKQRVALARALMTVPRLLLLDEPLASIDQPLREKVLGYLRRVRDVLGTPMIYVTHQPYEALALSSACIVLNEGRVAAHGRTAEVLQAGGRSGTTDNIFEVGEPEHDPDRGVTRVKTADGLALVLPWDQVVDARFPLAVRISTEDVMLFLRKPEGISSRNVFAGVVQSIVTSGGITDAAIAIPALVRVRITRDASEELRLREGLEVWLALRSRAFRIVG